MTDKQREANALAEMTAETCENCGRKIGQLETPRLFNGSVVCAECEVKLKPVAIPYASPAPPQFIPQPATFFPPRSVCNICGGELRHKTISSGNCGGIAMAMIVFCVGIILFFSIPIIGWVFGPIICFCALFMGGKRSKVIHCRSCKAIAAQAG